MLKKKSRVQSGRDRGSPVQSWDVRKRNTGDKINLGSCCPNPSKNDEDLTQRGTMKRMIIVAVLVSDSMATLY